MGAQPATLRLVHGGVRAPSPGTEAPETQAPGAEARKPEPRDDVLVAGLREGDPAICDTIYRLHARDVWRMLHRILGDDPDLDDLHHEVFVQALRSAARFRQEASLKTWLLGIAVNCARTKLRSRRRRWWLRFVAPEDLPETPDHEGDEDAAQTAHAVYQIAERLPAEERIAFMLRYVEGMSTAEIAAAMGCSAGTVKRRLSRGSERFFALARRHPALRNLCTAQQSAEQHADDGREP